MPEYLISTRFKTVAAEATAAAAQLAAEYADVGTQSNQASVATANTGRIAAASGQLATGAIAATANTTRQVGNNARIAGGQARDALGNFTGSARNADAALRPIPPHLRDATAEARRFDTAATSGMRGAASSAGALISRLAAIAAAYIGIRQVLRGLSTGVRDQIGVESANVAMAALIRTNFEFPGVPSQALESYRQAQQFTQLLAEDASRLPGEFSDFVRTAQAISGPLFAAGQNLDDLRTKVASLARMGPLIPGIQGPDMANQAARMLMGQAGADNPLAMALKSMGLLNVEFEAFNKMAGDERARVMFEAINKALADPALIQIMEASADVQFSTLKDNLVGVQGLLGQASKIIKDEMVVQAARLNDWFANNEDRVTALAETLASRVVPLIGAGADLLVFALENTQAIAAASLTIAAAWGATALSTKALAAFGGGSALTGASRIGDKLLPGILGIGTGATVATALPAALPAATAATATGATAAATTAATATGAAAATGATAAGATAALPAVAIGIAVIAAAVAVTIPIAAGFVGALELLNDETSRIGAWMRSSLAGIRAELGDTVTATGEIFKSLARDLAPIAAILAGGMLENLLVTLRTLNWALENFATSIETVSRANAAVGAFFSELLLAGRGINPLEAIDNAFAAAANAYTQYAPDTSPLKLSTATTTPDTTKLPTPKTEINIGQIVMDMKFDRDVSPDRIAFGLVEELEKIRSRQPRLRPHLAT